MIIKLPEAVTALWSAQCALKKQYAHTKLSFTLDGKLVGDIGEAVAADAFDLILCRPRVKGVDAHTRDGRSVSAIGQARKEFVDVELRVGRRRFRGWSWRRLVVISFTTLRQVRRVRM